MTRRILFATAVLCVVFAGVALAADISGNWSGTLNAGGDAVPLSFTFKQDGGKLTGTVISPHGTLALNEGKVEGDKISFFVTADMDGGPTKFVMEGALKGEEITLNIKAEAGPDFGPTLLKRAK
jgi:hypothetical protein